jgi:hypothetical protein
LIHPTTSLLLSANHAAALLRRRLALHLLRDLDVDFEELAHATVQADRLAFVEVGFAVLGRDALFGAGVDEPGREEDSQFWVAVFLRGLDVTYWLNMLETISISASAAAIFSAEEGWGRAPPKRKDILWGYVGGVVVIWLVGCVG